MSDLAEFLAARFDEDAVAATMRESHNSYTCDSVLRDREYTYPCDCGVPERMMREVVAKRKMLALHADAADIGESEAEMALLNLMGAFAAVYCDHPDFRQDWA